MQQQDAQDRHMDAMAVPVVEDPQLPSMDPVPDATEEEGTQPPLLGVMDQPPPSAANGGADGDAETMAADEPTDEYPDMVPSGEASEEAGAAAFAAGVDAEGYVRLLVEVDRGEMSILDASVVEGPLVQPELTGALAYEVTVGDRRVGAGAFDDLTEQHGYAPPDDETPGHRIGEVSRFQFAVRIPRSEITQDQLADLRIALVRPETTTRLSEDIAPGPGVSFEAAAVESGIEEPPVVATLEGISLADLPSAAAEALRRGLR